MPRKPFQGTYDSRRPLLPSHVLKVDPASAAFTSKARRVLLQTTPSRKHFNEVDLTELYKIHKRPENIIRGILRYQSHMRPYIWHTSKIVMIQTMGYIKLWMRLIANMSTPSLICIKKWIQDSAQSSTDEEIRRMPPFSITYTS